MTFFINTKADLARHRRVFTTNWGIPVFNAVGNHDLDGAIMKPCSARRPSRSMWVLTASWCWTPSGTMGRIIGRQAELLFEATELARQGASGTCSRSPIAPSGPRCSPCSMGCSSTTPARCLRRAGPRVLEALDAAAAGAGVFWFAGSMGGGAPASHPLAGDAQWVVYGMSAVRDEPRDALLLVSVDDDGVHPEACPHRP